MLSQFNWNFNCQLEHLISDVGGQTVNIFPFKIDSQTGYIGLENISLENKNLHKFCQSNIKRKKFKQDISAFSCHIQYSTAEIKGGETCEIVIIEIHLNKKPEW